MMDRLQQLIDAASFNDCRGMDTVTISYDDATHDYIITIGKQGRMYYGQSTTAAFNMFLEDQRNETTR